MNSGDKAKMPNSLSPDERVTKLLVLPKQVKNIKDSKELDKEELEIL